MAEQLTYYRLGEHPKLDALRAQALYANEGVDALVHEEFGVTVDAYRELPHDAVVERIEAKYSGTDPLASAVLGVIHGDDIGMAFWGEKDFERSVGPSQIEIVRGVNVSAWILRQYRAMRFGNQLIAHATDLARAQVTDPSLTHFYDRMVWTSIKIENFASRRACRQAGFVEIGTQPDKPDRLLYIADAA